MRPLPPALLWSLTGGFSPGQYVLTGMQGSGRKHLLLVDPQGVVRSDLSVVYTVYLTVQDARPDV